MASILNDKELKKILGKIIENGDESCIRPNSYVIRLGKTGEFLNSGKEFELGNEKKGIRIQPGHAVALTSYETINFKREVVREIYPDSDLHAVLSPTTDLSREGLVAPTTQIDAGYSGTLNWTITNTSSEERRFVYRENIFRLTILKLQEGETPEQVYSGDYQGQKGYVRSRRKGPPVGMKDTEWADSIMEGGPEILLENLSKSGYPWHLLGERFRIIDQQFKTVTEEYSDIHDSIEALTKDVNEVRKYQDSFADEVRKYQDGFTDKVRSAVKEETTSLQNRWLIGAGSLIIGFIGLGLSATSNVELLNFIESNALVLGVISIGIASIALYLISKK